jgi:glycosyltransferase involved in cell wall biosynthesis
VPDVPVKFAQVQRRDRDHRFLVAAVCSFNYDEPVEAMFNAARALPDVQFVMTGNPKALRPEQKADVPANVVLTGFLPDADYAGLLTTADAVMALTTRDHTMLRAAYEAIYQGTPVIVSDWPLLRSAFDEGAVHVENSAAGIAAGVRRLQAEYETFRPGAQRLRERKLEQWNTTLFRLRALVGATA